MSIIAKKNFRYSKEYGNELLTKRRNDFLNQVKIDIENKSSNERETS